MEFKDPFSEWPSNRTYLYYGVPEMDEWRKKWEPVIKIWQSKAKIFDTLKKITELDGEHPIDLGGWGFSSEKDLAFVRAMVWYEKAQRARLEALECLKAIIEILQALPKPVELHSEFFEMDYNKFVKEYTICLEDLRAAINKFPKEVQVER